MQLSELSLPQQKALFEAAAAAVLPRWNLGDCDIGWISYGANAVFHVHATASPYVLRLHWPGRVSESRLRSELVWLRAIRQRTNLVAPWPLPTSDGRFFATCSPASPYACRIHGVLFERLTGESKPAAALTAADLRAVGVFLGVLHRAAQFDPPADFDRPRLDFVGLFGADSPYHVAHESEFLTPEQGEIFRAVTQRVGQAMSLLDHKGAGSGLIHADLLAKNLIFSYDSVAALDFEYCGWGYFLYDLAPLLWQLKGDRADDCGLLEEALWQGYASVRADASAERDCLEDFIAARQLLSCRWLLQNQHLPDIQSVTPALLQARVEELKGYLSAGILLRRSATM